MQREAWRVGRGCRRILASDRIRKEKKREEKKKGECTQIDDRLLIPP